MRRWTVNVAIAAVLVLGSGSMARAQETDGIPEDPVSAESLPGEDLAAFRAPLSVTVLPQALTGHVGPMSFTSGTQRELNMLNVHGGFEPMAWRPMLRPVAGTEPGGKTIAVDNRFRRAYPEGLFDGGRVRVYQAIDGKLTLIRDSRVPEGGHRASGWKGLRGWLQTDPKTTQYRVVFYKNARMGVPYWFAVRAIYEDAAEGPASNAVQVTPTEPGTGNVRPWKAGWDRGLKPAVAGRPQPTAPKLSAELRDGVAHLSWSAVPPEGVLGYAVYYSEIPPGEFKGYGLDLETAEPRPDRPIQARDIVFASALTTQVRKRDFVSNLDWNRPGFWPDAALNGFAFWPDENPDTSWELVEHPGPVPADFTGAGDTCLRMLNRTTEPVGIMVNRFAGSNQSWYTVLRAVPHTVEAWVRGSGTLRLQVSGCYATKDEVFPHEVGQRTGEFPIEPIDLPVDGTWRKVRATFRPAGVPESTLGGIYLTFTGPGEVYVDNLMVYESEMPPGDYPPQTLEEIRGSGMSLMRTHELIKTQEGYTLGGMTNGPGGLNYCGTAFRPHTFYTLLRQMKLAGNISPWLQVEMCLDEDEWRGFAEWMCASYDPAVDTPQSKPWAYKRYAMGQEKPWIDEFDRFAFEISNETWNGLFAPYNFGGELVDGATGEPYRFGETYGLFFEYVIDELRNSPYWTEDVEAKTDFMLCGWGAGNYGPDARRRSPSSDQITSAGYCHNSGLGDPAEVTDFKYFYQLQWGLSAVDGQTAKEILNRKELLREGHPVRWGIYEFGPAYHVGPGNPPGVVETDQRLARGTTCAVYVLDAVLRRARAGYADQAFFTFGRNTGPWGTHTTLLHGGHGYPKWKAMKLFNFHGTGRFLDVQVESVPTWDFPAYVAQDNMRKRRRDALPDAPLVSTFASAQGDRLTVFLLSRKLDNFPVAGDDGYTPAQVRLPFRSAAKVTLYKIAGDPRVDDRFEEHTKVERIEIDPARARGTLVVDETTGADRRGLPPASIFCYVFEGVDLPALNARPMALIGRAPTAVAGRPVELPNISSDPDAPADGLRCAWSVDELGEFEGVSPTVTFPKIGSYGVRLSVDDGRGGTDTDQVDVQVAVRDEGGNLWSIWGPAGKARTEVAAEDGRLVLKGGGRVGGPSALAGMKAVSGALSFSATVTALGAPDEASVPAAGVMLGSQPLWFSYWRPSLEDGVLVQQDGSVWCRRFELLPAGSVGLPATLAVSVADGVAVFTVKEAGKPAREVHRVDDVPAGLYPMLGVASGSFRPAEAVFENITVNEGE